jgi:hypothetical protein
VYHEDVRRETAGTKGPSVNPTMNRQRQNPQPLVNAGMQIVVIDHANMIAGIRILGFPLAIKTLAGTCEMI